MAVNNRYMPGIALLEKGMKSVSDIKSTVSSRIDALDLKNADPYGLKQFFPKKK